ncbi:MAG: GntR family transcriptional regulator, partial [Cloacibacillus sp.]
METVSANAGNKKDQNLSSTIYESIKERIINGDFLPGGILMERTIADEFGVSRTPVREALKRLSQEGWVDWEERRRAVV